MQDMHKWLTQKINCVLDNHFTGNLTHVFQYDLIFPNVFNSKMYSTMMNSRKIYKYIDMTNDYMLHIIKSGHTQF